MISRSEEDRIDHHLKHAEEAWGELPQIAAEFESWDQGEQMMFLADWPSENVRLGKLAAYAADLKMSPEQLARYEELKKLVEKNRPIIERLLKS